MEILQQVLTHFNDFLWTYVIVLVLICCAVYFTIRTGFVQFGMIGEMFHVLTHPERKKEDGQKHISSFEAFVVALASRIGTGNLAGVATAIYVGGPGSVFWMWIIALLGSASAFIESTLAQLYKRKAEDSYIGGPAYYMKYGLGKGWMGVLFAILMMVTFGLAYNSVQSNTICAAWNQAFGINTTVMGIILTALTLIIIFGGIHRIAKFSSAVVPLMAIAYLLLALGIMAVNITSLPHVFAMIFKGAFGWDQAFGGALGVTVIQGIKRGLFSNEAGEGSAPNAAATATVSHPVKQGLIQALGVFTDTLVVCSCTAFIILVSGVDITASNGIQLTQDALTAEIGALGNPFIAIVIWLFAFSSIIGNYYYGEANVLYITKKKGYLYAYRIIVSAVVMIGSLITLDLAWCFADLTMACLALCNLIAITMLSKQAVFLLKDYRKQRRAGQDPVFSKDKMPEIAEKIECW